MLSASAAADSEEAITRCEKVVSVADRIICLENALRRASTETGQAARNQEAMRLPETDMSRDDDQPNDSLEQVADSGSDSPDIQAESTATDSAAPASNVSELKDQRATKEIEAMKVTVTAVRRSLNRRYVFETADGHTWLQTDQRNVRLGNAPFTAEIRPASMGSFYLKPDAGSVSIRVRREK